MLAESNRQISLGVSGLNCASCVARVEKALLATKGVQEATVNLANSTALVSGSTSAEGLRAALDDAGYPAREDTVRLNIESLSCASCVNRVENALLAVPGVLSASINLANGSALVTSLAGSNSPGQLLSASDAVGYPARLAESSLAATAHQETESLGLKKQLILSVLLTLPVFILEMGGHLVPAFHHWQIQQFGQQALWLFQFTLCTAVLIGPGRMFFQKGIPALLKARPDMNTLVAMGSGASWAYSVVATFLPSILPDSARSVYYEAACVIITLIILGRYLETNAKGQTGQAVRKLIGLQVKTAHLERGGEFVEVPIEDITVGNHVLARPGDRIATDGTVISGDSHIDESMISGEPAAVKKTVGSPVIGGTVNGGGALVYRAERIGKETMLAQIIQLVEQAQASKLPVQDLVNRIAAWFVPAVLLLAVLTIGIWLFLGPEPVLAFALVAGVSVLIVACPCAMGLATPTSIMVATGTAAGMGVLFKKGAALQSLQASTVVALDKTGTLTAGKATLTDIHLTGNWGESELLSMVAAVETLSEHPVAHAIVKAVRERDIAFSPAVEFKSITGSGVQGSVNGQIISLGSARLMEQLQVDLGGRGDEYTDNSKDNSHAENRINSVGSHFDSVRNLASEGKTPLYVAIDGSLAAVLAVADPIKPSTPATIQALQARGLKVAMITGDNRHTANAIAAELNIEHVYSEVLPEGKVEAIDALRANGNKIVFVGDGINDAPALAAADTGIAIGNGTDVAIESADVILVSGKLDGVLDAINISQHTMSNIRQNLFWAFGYNILLIPIAAGALYASHRLMLSPMLAAAAMSLSSIFVLTNSLRLKRLRSVTTRPGG